MEPLITLEGYNMMQNSQQSRELLNDYYRQQGYQVVTPKAQSAEEEYAEKAPTPAKEAQQEAK